MKDIEFGGEYKRFDAADACEALADQYGIDLSADIPTLRKWIPVLAEFDNDGTTAKTITEEGAAYTLSQIDYLEAGLVQASRMVARISAGQRLGLAYHGLESPAVKLTVHRGQGELILANPRNSGLQYFGIDSSSNLQAIIPPGLFYTVRAATDSAKGLVVSALYEKLAHDCSEIERDITAGNAYITDAGKTIPVPRAFRAL